MDTPFETLGIERGADEGEIEAAYRRRVKEVHPDQGGSVDEFRAVQRAYERLLNDASSTDHVGDDPAPDPPQTAVVEYLDYEVLADHGWALDDERLFEKAADAALDPEDYGEIEVEPGQYLLEAAESAGLAWPFACRGGACSNCAIKVIEGEIPPPTSHVLPPELIERGIRLSCITAPITDEAKVVYNVKHLPDVEELLLSASRFERKHA